MWKIIVVLTLFTGDVSAARIGSLEYRSKQECAIYLAEHGIKVGTGAMIFARKVRDVGEVVSLTVECVRL